MSWLFSQALVEEYSAANCLDGEQFAPLNLMPTARPFLHNGRTTDALTPFRYGQTCKLLTEDLGARLLMWFREVSLAKTFPVLEKAQVFTERNQDSGGKWRGSSVKYDPLTACWKILRCSLLGDWEPYSGTWPRWGTMQNGECWERTIPAHLTNVNASGYLPTPSGCRSGKNHVAGRLDEWGGSSNPWRGTENGKTHCADFEEWIMGWPERWTVLTESVTDKFQQWWQKHGRF